MTRTSPTASRHDALQRLIALIARLRDPQGGCPWDLAQTHDSLKPFALEETYELLDAIDSGSDDALRDELGDVLLQVLLHSQLARERGAFDIADVAHTLSEKLVRRHPHVFGDGQAEDAQAVANNWQAIKRAEKAGAATSPASAASVLAGVSRAWPALMRATRLSARAVKVGFKWPNAESLWACVMSEVEEFRAETRHSPPSHDALEDELGDMLFATVSLANFYGVDSETALARANEKFTRRFQAMEARVGDTPLEQLSYEQWDALWRQAKRTLASE